jgi:hypothetical protein
MRQLALALILAAAAPAAHADPVEEARSAMGACLSAIIDHAPVDDIDGDDVAIRRGKDPSSCTVLVNAGQPVVIRDAVLAALAKRSERLKPARTAWDAGEYASREAFCSVPSRRNFVAVVSTGKPGSRLVLSATVLEAEKRDTRCDRNEGLQAPPAAG